MKKSISLILILCCMLSALSAYAVNEDSAATKVVYNGSGESYYELDVPSKMSPGDSGTVSLTGTWEASRVIKVTSDWDVAMRNKSDGEEIYLDVFFDGIKAFGDNVNEISVSEDIYVDYMGDIFFGVWNGVFNYYVDVANVEMYTGSEHAGVIPYGGTYYVMATGDDFCTYKGDYSLARETLVAGDEFPEIICDGDVYVYGDYEYRYNCGYEDSWFNYNCDGWGVTVRNTGKSSYGEMLTSINGKNIKNTIGTFMGCSNLKYSPVIPESVEDMFNTFRSCTSLVESPVIPDGVTSLGYAYYDCILLKEAPDIPLSVTNLNGTFTGCRTLTVPPVIHENITDIFAAFDGCSALTGTMEINAKNLINYNYALLGTNITEIAGTISDNLKEKILETKYMN